MYYAFLYLIVEYENYYFFNLKESNFLATIGKFFYYIYY